MGNEKRVRVERNLYRRGKTFYACATPPGTSQALWKSLGEVGVMEARRARDEWVVEVRRMGGAVLLDRSTTLTRTSTVAEVADDMLLVVEGLVKLDKLAKNTESSYRTGVNLHVKPYWPGRRVVSVSANEIVDWVQDQQESSAAAWSIRARWTALKLVFAHAERHGLIARSPVETLKPHERPGPGLSSQRFLDGDEIARLFERATALRTRVLVGLLLFAGLRASEALGLIWDEIDALEDLVRVRFQMSRDGRRSRIKTDRRSRRGRRDVATMKALMKLLAEWRLATRWSAGSDLVLTNNVGNTMGYWDLLDDVTDLFEAAGIDGATPHSLRHTFASELIAQGRTLDFVADQLGISPQTAQRVYIHLVRAREQGDASREAMQASYGAVLKGA